MAGLTLASLQFTTAIAITLLGVFFVGVRRLWRHPLSKFPGSRVWAISRLPWVRHMVRGDLWQALHHQHDKYGPIIRIAPNELSILSPSAWQEIYASRPLLLKEPLGQTPPLNGAHSLFTAEGSTHKRIRGVFAYAFSDKALRDQSPLIESHATELIARIRREIQSTPDHALDIQKFYGYAAFDIITDLSYGKSACGLKKRNEHDNIEKFFLHAQYSTVRNCLRWYSPLDKVLDFFFLHFTRKTRQQNWAKASAKIERRLDTDNPTGNRCDLMTPVIGRVTGGVGNGVSKAEVLTNALAFVIASSQLTTVGLTNCTYYLLQNRLALAELHREISDTFTSDDQITVRSTQDLVYLNAVINESLRIRHPSPICLPRVVPQGGRVIDGNFIPEHTIIGINLQNIQNSTTCWVEPQRFLPERFLPPEDPRYDARFDRDVKAAFMPFSVGQRNCVGGKLFLAQARVILAKVLWNFDLTTAESDMLDWLNQRVCIVFEPKPLRIKVAARELTNSHIQINQRP